MFARRQDSTVQTNGTVPQDDLYSNAMDVDDQPITEENVSGGTEHAHVYWMFLVHESGLLQMIRCPEYTVGLQFPRLDAFPTLIQDTVMSDTQSFESTVNRGLEEIVVSKFPNSTPMLAIRNSKGRTAFYDSFHPRHSDAQGHRLDVRFHRLDIHASTDLDTAELGEEQRRMLIPFQYDDYNGIFLAGNTPKCLIRTKRGDTYCHPIHGMGINTLTTFHNIHCEQGFVIMDDEEHLRIMTFPTNVQLDFYMPFNKVPLRQSAHKITYDRTARKHVVATSTPTNFYLRDENDQLVGKADQPGYLFPQVDRHALQLVSPVTWRSVHTFDFSEYERVLALDYVTLENHASSTGYKSYIAVGTAMALGEDIAVKGSIYMFEVITVVPDPTDPQTNHKLKLVYREEVKGAVTCIGCMKGFLVTTVNKQIIVRTFEDNEHLNGIAFIDAQILPTTLNIVKNFVLLGDFTKSVWFIGFQEEPPKMQLLGKDVHQVEVSASEFVMDHKLLYFCVADSFGNLFLLTYSPFNIQSQGGQRLVRRGEMATGKHVLCMRRVVLDRDGLMQASLMGGKDGSLAMVLPLQERVYKRLLLLGSRMVSGVQHVAALNPKAMRIVAPKYRVDMQNLRSTLVDLDLMRNYLHIPTGHQKDLAKQVGTDAERVLADLQELDGMVQRL